jgi:hypothetical protein
LANIGKHLNPELWNIIDLTTPGWRINDNSVASMVTALTETAGAVNWATATVILQLFDNSVYMVSGPGGEKFLPKKDKRGTYHIEGSLAVADKAAVKDLVARLSPLLKELGDSRKIVLTPLARYWVSPCCEDVSHHINYRTPGYLPRLGDAVHALKDNIRDSLYTKKVQNFRVLCPNRMIGVGQRLQVPTDEEAAKAAALWGRDPVHPTVAAYRCMADQLEQDMGNPDSKYTNPKNKTPPNKRPRLDLSLERADWVTGCSAATSRQDLRGRTTPRVLGHRGYWPARRGGGLHRSGSTRGSHRGSANKFSGFRRGGPYYRGGEKRGTSF